MPEEQTEMSEIVRYELLKMIRDLAARNKAAHRSMFCSLPRLMHGY